MRYIIFFLFSPIFCCAQWLTGYTFTNEAGDINVRQYDTITTPSGIDYRISLISFTDSTAAANYLEGRKNALFEQAGRWAQMAHEDSLRANRIRQIGSDSGLFSIAPEPPLPIELPAIITVPEPQKKPVDTPKKKTTKQKKKTKKPG